MAKSPNSFTHLQLIKIEIKKFSNCSDHYFTSSMVITVNHGYQSIKIALLLNILSKTI